MTAKEILRITNIENDCEGIIAGGSLLEKSIIKAMKEYTRHIAGQAVGDVKKKNIGADLHDVGWNGACNVILTRINELTQGE